VDGCSDRRRAYYWLGYDCKMQYIFKFVFVFFFLFLEQYDMNIRRVVEIGMVCQKETILMQILTTVSNDHCGILLLLMLSAAFSEFMLQFLG
jgi:hypothetical protein